ncbi:MAG: matrixin family metalloprotease [Methanolobus sp.]|uniref:matrixin family metalloprotease n=1 Tax=Methanolobus sp. TaxID=1874737 RepID=UPI00272FFC94|nr:matrixin family metalloprotease [Methanolobus sp.]MDP2216276.1 matrixin family metalloprotease [Methanolobus sp.]
MPANKRRRVLFAILALLLIAALFSPSEKVYPLLNPDPWENIPITVYIDDRNVPAHYSPSYRVQVERALEYWSSGGNGKLGYTPEFEIVEEDNADILIMWVENLQKDAGVPEGVAGFARPYEVNGRYERVEIVLEVGNYQGYSWRQYGDANMREIAKHEIGHALGLGHSNDRKDIMFPTYDQKDDINPLLVQKTLPLIIAGILLSLALVFYHGGGWLHSRKKREKLEEEILGRKEK